MSGSIEKAGGAGDFPKGADLSARTMYGLLPQGLADEAALGTYDHSKLMLRCRQSVLVAAGVPVPQDGEFSPLLEPKALKPGGTALTRDEKRIEEQRMADEALYEGRPPVPPGTSLVGITHLGDRVRMKQVQTALAGIGAMDASSVRLQAQVSEFNDSARATDPGLFSDASDTAARMNKAQPDKARHVTADEILGRSMDPAEEDPAVLALQRRMLALSRDPRLASMRADIVKTASTLTGAGRYVSSVMGTMKGGNAAAVEKVVSALEDTVGRRVADIPPLATDRPGPGSFGSRLQTSSREFADSLTKVADDMKRAIVNVVPR